MFRHMTDFVSRVSRAALALPLFLLLAAPAAVAQSETGAQTARRMELEKRIRHRKHVPERSPLQQREDPGEIKDGVEFVTGNVLFVLAHETGHALISALEIPVAGREEDAADQLATVMALKMADSFADRVVVNAARGWFLGDQRDKKAGVPTVFYDEHGMDLQRAYHIVCLLVGGAAGQIQRACRRSEASTSNARIRASSIGAMRRGPGNSCSSHTCANQVTRKRKSRSLIYRALSFPCSESSAKSSRSWKP